MKKAIPLRTGYQRAAAGIVGCLLVGGSLGLKMQEGAPPAPGDTDPVPALPGDSFPGAEEEDYLALRRHAYRQPEKAAPLQPSIVQYTVQPGDSLWKIAQALDTPVEVLMDLNQGVRPLRLQPGQKLRVITGSDVETGRRRSIAVASRSAESRSSRTARAAVETQPEATAAVAPAEQVASAPAVASTSMIWPVTGAVATSEFGPRWGTLHRGIDLAVPAGTPAVAAQSGTVVFAGWDGTYGYCVVIDHGNGVQTRYAHASALLVTTGDWVEQGTPILEVGSTGYSTGPHLHFEVIVGGEPQNPRLYLP
ncbi:MAG TPA: M23 family metallopeptidase [Symbiobacteriaceae bacterium]